MTWKPSDDMDKEIRRWMKAKGLGVNRPPEYDREIHAWRHQVRGRPSRTLRISRGVLEGYPAFAVVELLDRLKVAAAIKARPDAQYVVVQNGLWTTLEEAPPE